LRFRPTVAEIDLDAIRHNVRLLQPASAELMAVVKADGYGHGALPVARAALGAGATWLGVALVEEGILLREGGIDAAILVLTEFPSGSEKDALAAGLTPTLYTEEGLSRLAEAAGTLGDARIGVHVKLDTGMHRVGLDPGQAASFAARIGDAALHVDGVWTHFAKAEDLDDPSARRQLTLFTEALDSLDAAGIQIRYRHCANSAATISLPESHLDLVRVGVALYGIWPGPGLVGRVPLRPAMSLRSHVGLAKRVAAGESVSYGLTYRLEKESTIATVPVGYADGYARALSDRGRVLIRGKRYPIAGTVTMDQLTVDCGDDDVAAGDEVVLFGRQGAEEITADEVASWYGTIGYEVVCAVSGRVPREYRGDG
jgi:alanine racemase